MSPNWSFGTDTGIAREGVLVSVRLAALFRCVPG